MHRRWCTLGQNMGAHRLFPSQLRSSDNTLLVSSCSFTSNSFSSPGNGGESSTRSPSSSPEPPLYAGNGSSYYCRKSDSGRAHKRIVHPGKTTLGPYEREILCSSRRHVVNMEKPPISSEQAERWKLDSLIYKRPLHFRVNKPQPALLLPPGQRIYSLGPEMDLLDAVYRQKGLFTPAEIAHVFIPIVPTFFVETRYVVERIPPDVLLTLDRHIPRSKFSNIFEHYPMLFKFHRRKFQRSAVKLNDDMWFVRAHPDFQKANVLQREHNADYNSSVGGVLSSHLPLPTVSDNHTTRAAAGDGEKVSSRPQEAWRPLKVRLFEILIRHLPRVPSSEAGYQAKRHAAVRLVEWINSFPQSEIDLLNKVAPLHLVFLLNRCVHIFQLVGDMPTDTNLFCDREHFTKLPQWKERLASSVDKAVAEKESTTTVVDEALALPTSTAAAVATEVSPPPKAGDDLLGVDELLLLDDDDGSTKPPLTIEQEEEELQRRHATEEDDEETFASGADDGDDDEEAASMAVNTPLESIYVRRRPPNVSPRSWSNFNRETTPEKDIFCVVASRLAPPPSISKDPAAKENAFYQSVVEIREAFTRRGEIPPPAVRFEQVWRWVLVDELYNLLTPAQRHRLPFYKGLVNFLRLHGEVFELSVDFRYVIAHDPSGIPAPYTPTQRDFSLEERAILPEDFDTDPTTTAILIGEAERTKHVQALGNTQVPTSRKQLAILDPRNPLLLSDVLHEEMAKLVPPRGHIVKGKLLSSLPPIMRAAMPASYNFAANTGITLFRDRGVTCLRRTGTHPSKSALEPKAPTLTLEEAIEVLRESIPEHGATPRALRRMYLPNEVVETFESKVGSLLLAVQAYPQYFAIEENAASPRDCIIRLKENGR